MKELSIEDKELLSKDLSARVPYGVKVKTRSIPLLLVSVRNDWGEIKAVGEGSYNEHIYNIEDIRPYLRPMSSMTKEELKTYHNLCYEDEKEILEYGEWVNRVYYYDTVNSIDYLNSIHIDYRGLIKKDLAIAVTEENNPYKSIEK